MFTSKIEKGDIIGTRRVKYGTFSQGSGDTGGVIKTGLYHVDYFQMMGALNVSIDEGSVTVTTADPGGSQAGFWMAVGM